MVLPALPVEKACGLDGPGHVSRVFLLVTEDILYALAGDVARDE
jgi:hypothetical protein